MGKIDLAEYLRDNGVEAFNKLKDQAVDVWTLRLKDTHVPVATLDKIKAVRLFIEDKLQHMDDTEKKMFIKRDVREHFDMTKTEINDILRGMVTNTETVHEEGYFDSFGRLQVKVLSEYVMSTARFITFKDTKEVYYYENGVYVQGGEALISKAVQVCLGNSSKRNHIAEIINYIQIETMIPRNKVTNDITRINLMNGLYNIVTDELEDHTPDYISIIQIPVIYDPEATCPMIEKFLSEVLQEEDVAVIVEFIGYSMIPDTRIQKSVMLVGKGANGKSKVLGLIGRFIGHHNCSHESLHMLEEDPYSPAELYGKLLNIFPDLASGTLYENKMFKQISGDDDELRVRRIYQTPFTFKNTARLIFSANDLPPVPGDSYAYFRRWVIIEFLNRFEGKGADDKILEKIATPDEFSGLLNLAIAGLKRLLINRDYSYNKTVEDVTRMYRINSDHISAFAAECVVYSDDDCSKAQMFSHYCDWCTRNKVEKKAENEFGKRFKKLGYVTGRQASGKRLHVWENCSILINLSKLQKQARTEKTDTVTPSVQASKLKDPLLRELENNIIENNENEIIISTILNNGSKVPQAWTNDQESSQQITENTRPGSSSAWTDNPDGYSLLDTTILQLKEEKHPDENVPGIGLFAVLVQQRLGGKPCLAEIENRVRQWQMNKWKGIA